MPYITQDRRRELTAGRHTHAPETAGELNFLMTLVLISGISEEYVIGRINALAFNYIKDRGLSYQIINDILGAMFGANAEYHRRTGSSMWTETMQVLMASFYREVAAPYEDTKIAANGDVYS